MDGIKPEAILTEEEKTACKEAFDAFDKFGYGTLEVEELQKVLEGKLKMNKTVEQIDNIYIVF